MQPGKKVRLTNVTTVTVKKEIGHGGQDDMAWPDVSIRRQ